MLATISEFPVLSGPSDAIEGIAAGPDGNLWFTEPGVDKIGMINTHTHAIIDFGVPGDAQPQQITAGPEGDIWFTFYKAGPGNSSIGKINPYTDAITELPAPVTHSIPNEITVGPDGNVWFTDPGADAIGMINPTTDAVTEYTSSSVGAFGSITSGPDGNLWFTDIEDYAIGTINPTTLAISEVHLPNPGRATGRDHEWARRYSLADREFPIISVRA